MQSALNPHIGVFIKYRSVSVRLLFLLLALYANKEAGDFAPLLWILVPVIIAAALSRARFGEAERYVVRLWQLVGLSAAIYALLHYPLMPPASGSSSSMGFYALVLFAWVISVATGILCFRIPSLSVLPPAFLIWVNAMARIITGLPMTTNLDIMPLAEVSVCIGLGLLINQLYHARSPDAKTGDAASDDAFINLLFMAAISIHLANYFWAFYAKMALYGPWGAWLTKNNPVYMFLVALDNEHIIFSGYPRLVEWTYRIFDAMHLYSNFWILACQGAAITAFFLPRWGFLILLFMFDLMHVSIMIIAGANFWPWILLNIVIAVVVAKHDFRPQPVALRLTATCFILAAPLFAHVAMLGWFDSGANNKIFFEAVDDAGRHYAVPTNFFTFYSYSFGHMDYGTPEPDSAFAVGSPNGGAWDYPLFKAGRKCDTGALIRPDTARDVDREKLSAFIRNYHRLALTIYSHLGGFPYDIYPHHFYVPWSQSLDFAELDKRRIVTYIYKRESVCLSFEQGALKRDVVTSAEYKIDLKGENHEGEIGNTNDNAHSP